MDSSPMTTPKRKHNQLSNDEIPILHPPRFSFEATTSGFEDGSSSPRTKVAHKFRGLALEEGGGGVGLRSSGSPEPAEDAMQEDDAAMRKRMKLPEPEFDELQYTSSRLEATDHSPESGAAQEGPKGEWATGLQVAFDPAVARIARTANRLQRAYPSINRLSDSKSRRKRAGTPPLVATKTKADPEHGDTEAEIVDPVRASLTWHEDEITIYDPDDKDDDGTGINGIGFKPTPALAYARALKRKQQLAEYKKREERDARAKRSQRRRGSPVPAVLDLKDSGAARHVHFMEVEPKAVVTL